MRVLLITPPMVQFNAPYAATPLLTGFLREHGVDVRQEDLSLKLALQLFSQSGLEQIESELRSISPGNRTRSVQYFVKEFDRYYQTIDTTIQFLQCNNRGIADMILGGAWLPHGPRFSVLAELSEHGLTPFANESIAHARYMASLYIDDLSDVIREGLDKHFGLSRYAEHLGAVIPSFDPLLKKLNGPLGYIDNLLNELVAKVLKEHQPDLVGITIPFPGNLYGAFRVAAAIRQQQRNVSIAMGGGYVNTEWRRLEDARVFDFTDYVLYDDGEDALLRLVNHLEGVFSEDELIRTRLRRDNQVVYINDADSVRVNHNERAAPCYDGLPLQSYCPMIESPNPMHRLWSERRWMKVQLAHGCYWHRCAFCDTSLDYINHYDQAKAERVIEWIEQVIQETRQPNFHFVDEAAPPALLQHLSELILERNLSIQWWTNVRFEKTFDLELTQLMARAGCLAVTGGMECAEERLLLKMDKGVTLETMARSAHAFAQSGMLVHAYLMYGFPTQTRKEIVDALEYVRQLFECGCLHSAFWHKFALTVHSPIYAEPHAFGIDPTPRHNQGFSENEIGYTEQTGIPFDIIGQALHRAVYNYMHHVALDGDVREWFEGRMPRPRIAPDAVSRALMSVDGDRQ